MYSNHVPMYPKSVGQTFDHMSYVWTRHPKNHNVNAFYSIAIPTPPNFAGISPLFNEVLIASKLEDYRNLKISAVLSLYSRFEILVIFEFRGDEYLIRKRENPRKIRWCRCCQSPEPYMLASYLSLIYPREAGVSTHLLVISPTASSGSDPLTQVPRS